MRDYQCGLNAVGIQNLLPSTSKTCVNFAKKHGISHSKIQLPDGTLALWLGPRKANKVIVFFHGGGYMAPALSEHMSFAFGFAKSPRKDVSVVVLQYGKDPSPK
jgi:acetyl esterase/lipase